MRTLAIDCATEACSVALFEGSELAGHAHVVLGRGHAEQLVPMIAQLPGKGEAQRIAVSLGPGSFTGVRIGIAAARALAIAWNAEVAGYPTLALVAAMARVDHPGRPVTVAMAGGHGEWFVQEYGADGTALAALASLAPGDAAASAQAGIVAGSVAAGLVELRGHGTICEILPDARFLPCLRADLFQPDVRPIYGRAPDARLPA